MQTSTLVTIASGNLARSPAEEYRYDEEPAELTQNATTARCVLLVESDWEGDSENETLKYWSQFDGQRVIVGLSDLRLSTDVSLPVGEPRGGNNYVIWPQN